METNKILIDLGFSENEAKVYLAALETGIASAQEIAQKCKLKRTTTYSVLCPLVRKGFIVQTIEKGKKRFFADDPKNLKKIFQERQKKLADVLPELEAVYNKKKIKPRVLFYEGLDGIKKIYEDTIKEKPDEILEWNTADIFRAFPGFPKEYLSQRLKNNIHAKRIASNEPRWHEHKKLDEAEISETKLLPFFDIPIEINIYKNKVAFMSYKDEMGLIIESKGIAEAMRKIYMIFWNKI